MSIKGSFFVILGLVLVAPMVRPDRAACEEDHSHHMHSMKKAPVRSLVSYEVPDLTLMNRSGEKVGLRNLLATDKPVMLNFIFATCNTICPVLSAGFASFQDELGAEASMVQLVSITIDPEHDTTMVLKDYSERFGAGPGWHFLTGTRDDINKAMKAFDAYATNKMNHRPLTFIHAPGTEQWLRIDGLMSSAEYMKEYRELTRQ
ncbi:MAG: SCO family protein [Candidatus Binatia bacterium]